MSGYPTYRELSGCRWQASAPVLHSREVMNRAPQLDGSPAGIGIKAPTGALRAFVAGAAGILTFCIMDLIDPQFVGFPSIEPSASVIFNLLLIFSYYLNSPYVVLPAALVWIYLAITRRDQPKSWIFAFLAGVAIPLIIFRFRWMLRWI
jgi:hypothetical protein